MNVQNIFFKKDAAPPNVKIIKVARYFICMGMALYLWLFAWTVISILHGAQDTSPYEHAHNLLSSLYGMILCSCLWFMTAARLSAKPARLRLISFVLMAVFVVLTAIDFWLMAPTMFSH